MFVRSLLAFTLLATAAVAQDYNRTDLVRGLCQPDGCDEFSIVTAEPVRVSAEGSLKRLRVRTFRASYSGREARGEETSHVHCSATKPAVVAEKSGRTVGILLAPFATEDTRETVRRYTNFAAVYFAACHGLEAGRSATRDLRGTAKSFGYRVAATRSRVVDLERPEDVLGQDGVAPPTLEASAVPRAAPATPAQDSQAEPVPPADLPED